MNKLFSGAVINFLMPIYFVLKLLSAYHICCIYSNALQKTFTIEVNTINPDLGPYCLQYAI